MLKRILQKIIRGQKGQTLPIVLVLMLLGGLLIVPTLNYASSTLRINQQVYETKTQALYAADAGIEDALHKIATDTVGETMPYPIADVNDKNVEVEVVTEVKESEEFYFGLLAKHYSGVHSDWSVVTNCVEGGTYNITVTYSGTPTVHIEGVGAWLKGTYEYKEGSASGMTVAYPECSLNVTSYEGGTAFIWSWASANEGPLFSNKASERTKTQTFQFTPEEIPSVFFSWVVYKPASIGVVGSTEPLEIFTITATATDNSTGKETEVTAYASREGESAPYAVSILTWQIS